VTYFDAIRDADSVEVSVPERARLELVCAGRVVDSHEGTEARLYAPAGAERCHVEAWLGSNLWIVTSPLL
jgi:hypothetical protein